LLLRFWRQRDLLSRSVLQRLQQRHPHRGRGLQVVALFSGRKIRRPSQKIQSNHQQFVRPFNKQPFWKLTIEFELWRYFYWFESPYISYILIFFNYFASQKIYRVFFNIVPCSEYRNFLIFLMRHLKENKKWTKLWN